MWPCRFTGHSRQGHTQKEDQPRRSLSIISQKQNCVNKQRQKKRTAKLSSSLSATAYAYFLPGLPPGGLVFKTNCVNRLIASGVPGINSPSWTTLSPALSRESFGTGRVPRTLGLGTLSHLPSLLRITEKVFFSSNLHSSCRSYLKPTRSIGKENQHKLSLSKNITCGILSRMYSL